MNPLTKSHTIERSTSYWSLGAYCTGFSEKGFCLFCSDWVKVCSAFLLFKRPQSLSVLPIWAVVYGRPDFYVEQKPDLPGSDLRCSLCCGSNKTRWSCTDIQVFSSEYTSAFRALLTAPKAKWSSSLYSEKQSGESTNELWFLWRLGNTTGYRSESTVESWQEPPSHLMISVFPSFHT